jgi:hypothetical protein
MHEAIMREPSDEVPDGTVVGEFRKGFRLGERLLRPAMVKVGGASCSACSWVSCLARAWLQARVCITVLQQPLGLCGCLPPPA